MHLQAPFTVLHVDNKKTLTTDLLCKERISKKAKQQQQENQNPKPTSKKLCNLSKEIKQTLRIYADTSIG